MQFLQAFTHRSETCTNLSQTDWHCALPSEQALTHSCAAFTHSSHTAIHSWQVNAFSIITLFDMLFAGFYTIFARLKAILALGDTCLARNIHTTIWPTTVRPFFANWHFTNFDTGFTSFNMLRHFKLPFLP
jgi:hypothetical protein